MSPQNSPQTPQDNQKPDTPFQTSVVTNIPMHAAGGPPSPAAPANSQDPNKIMRDVGDLLKKEDVHKPKHHFWDKKSDSNQSSKFSAQPVPKDVAQARPVPAPVYAQTQTPPATLPHSAKAAAAPVPPKPKSSVPVMAILITLVVTGGLIALAVVSLS